MKRYYWKTLSLLLIILHFAFVNAASASPETIKAGRLYYADEYEIKSNIAQLGEERNHEEVFKNYNYYEASYDEHKRIILFRAYKKGEVEWEEHYTYHPGGGLASRKIIEQGKPEQLENFPATKDKEYIK